MAEKELHPSIQEFRQFIKKHPKMIMEVRRGKKTWKELYEEWYVLGENDSYWDRYKSEEEISNDSFSSSEKNVWLPQLLNSLKKMDPEQLQKHVNNLSEMLGAIQGLISQFQKNNEGKNESIEQMPSPHPFHFRHD